MFQSPASLLLPSRSRLGYMDILFPPKYNSLEDTIHLPALLLAAATGEDNMESRLVNHAIPLIEQSNNNKEENNDKMKMKECIVVMLVSPFYAQRRPEYQEQYFLMTASDVILTVAIMGMELASIASWLNRMTQTAVTANTNNTNNNNSNNKQNNKHTIISPNSSRTVIYASRSMGASSAAISSLLTNFRHDLAVIAPLMASSDGFVDGVFSSAIPWSTLSSEQCFGIECLFREFDLSHILPHRTKWYVERFVHCIQP